MCAYVDIFIYNVNKKSAFGTLFLVFPTLQLVECVGERGGGIIVGRMCYRGEEQDKSDVGGASAGVARFSKIKNAERNLCILLH